MTDRPVYTGYCPHCGPLEVIEEAGLRAKGGGCPACKCLCTGPGSGAALALWRAAQEWQAVPAEHREAAAPRYRRDAAWVRARVAAAGPTAPDVDAFVAGSAAEYDAIAGLIEAAEQAREVPHD